MRLAPVIAVLFVLASSLSGCTLLGASIGAAQARDQNARRELALEQGDREAPPHASIAGSALTTGLVGAVIDVVLVSAYISYSHESHAFPDVAASH